jgi:Fic family protein
MRRGLTGHHIQTAVGGETVAAFVPSPLPPVPPLAITGELRRRLDQALVSLGRLDSVSALLPETSLFLYTYIRKEAVLSSQIEGTQSSLSDLLLFELEEAPGVPLDDAAEVSSYVAALEHGLTRIREGFPLSSRLLREIHGVLLAQGRGADKQPGEFRRTQNWIGGTRPGNAAFVPPPANEVAGAITLLERFLHDEVETTSTLIKAALAHVQFETIHPFLDGNGRVGRLMIALIFAAEGVLHQPLLYLSLYFKLHRTRYYELLDIVRRDGDWEAWLMFFADAVVATAESAVTAARDLTALFAADREQIRALGRNASSALQVHEVLQRRPLASTPSLRAATGRTLPTVLQAIEALETLGIVREVTGRKRNRVFAYQKYLEILARE